MDDNVLAFELTDGQLAMVTGGSSPLPVTIHMPTTANTAVNISQGTQSNTILFRKISHTPVGSVCVSQSHTTVQHNSVG